MKLKLTSFLFALAFGFVSNTNAQDGYFKCGHDEYTKKLWAENPELKADFQQLIASSKTVKSNGFNAKADTTFYIPIVFHILHEYGTENITDAQVYDAVAILNRDYRKLNADVANAVANFGDIAANTEIQFRLATIDPYGNCTNGIEHIYTHETTQGDDNSKLNQWHRSKYLNIWVSQKIGSEGAAGYAYYPSGAEGNAFFRDGIIINPTYIGSIGSSSDYSSRALTHEVGHYLGLPHVWGDNNDPGQGQCADGDDGIDDTPLTKGFNYCPSGPNAAKICDTSVVENYQNYMEYSYCSVMFTEGQSQRMRSILIGETSSRNNLWVDSNLVATGTTGAPAPTCTPVADFNQKTRYTCVGGSITFTDVSWNAAIENRTWRFEGGSPATSTSATQAVTFDSPGYKKVTLVVSNAAGADSIVNEKSVYVSGNWGDLVGPSIENFESTYPLALVENPENNYAKWHLVNGVNGISAPGSKAMKLNNYKNTANAQLFTEEYFYNFRLGGNKDAIVTPSFDLRHTTNTQLTFDYAYATNASTLEELTEEMIIYSSTNCGSTWQQRKKITKAELLTGGNSTGMDFVPTAAQWKTYVLDLPGALALNKSNTRFKIEFVSSDVSNNVYIDNIRMTGILGLEESPIEAMNINVYPNPTSSSNGINIDYTANNEAVEFQLLDIQGKVIATESNTTTNASVSHKMGVNAALSTGCYYLKITQGDFSTTKKVVVL